MVFNHPKVSNQHFLLWPEKREGNVVAILTDISRNGTFVNDEISTMAPGPRFVFRYPVIRTAKGFFNRYQMIRESEVGHSLCVDQSTAKQYAVKVFGKPIDDSQETQSQNEIMRQEISILMRVNHPNLQSLHDFFHEVTFPTLCWS